ncbi:dNTP triphosphohydrolase [Thermoanaerobacterium thermosaccharolyticum]|uniref:dGTP triphosphohydrolase n=1 Tax=Thermoanaerobacterium thermosaccharolyticum TaxID=1517 RepID=UPI003DA8B6AA
MRDNWIVVGNDLIQKQDEMLAPYAIKNIYSITDDTRIYKEDIVQNDTRTPFQHDRDRIIHSRAFRRLRGKTQVFMSAKGDHYRTRISHTMEVQQISRSIARVFSLNEDLTEAIALGHDLGHTPFGHIGERTLDKILRGNIDILDIKKDYGGFKHNYNSLKMVDSFEKAYTKFRGLNLTKWTREGIWKHTELVNKKDGKTVYDKSLKLEMLHPEISCCTFLEGQIVAISDEIAQVAHDLEDAFRAKILTIDNKSLNDIKLFYDIKRETNINDSLSAQEIRELIGNLIKALINSIIKQTKEIILSDSSINPNEEPLNYQVFKLEPDIEEQYKQLRKILYDTITYSYEISRMDIKGEHYIKRLFEAYYEDPKRLPDYTLERYSSLECKRKIERKDLTEELVKDLRKDMDFIRIIADQIAGMTDLYAIDEYRRLYLPDVTSITII